MPDEWGRSDERLEEQAKELELLSLEGEEALTYSSPVPLLLCVLH